jgi:hypothetical protein
LTESPPRVFIKISSASVFEEHPKVVLFSVGFIFGGGDMLCTGADEILAVSLPIGKYAPGCPLVIVWLFGAGSSIGVKAVGFER